MLLSKRACCLYIWSFQSPSAPLRVSVSPSIEASQSQQQITERIMMTLLSSCHITYKYRLMRLIFTVPQTLWKQAAT